MSDEIYALTGNRRNGLCKVVCVKIPIGDKQKIDHDKNDKKF